MKYLLFIIGVAFSFTANAQQAPTKDYDTLTVSGKYSGKDIFVKNKFSDGEGFTVQAVLLNNEVTTGEYNQSAFQIKLSETKAKIGDKLIIALVYQKGRVPIVLNPEVLE